MVSLSPLNVNRARILFPARTSGSQWRQSCHMLSNGISLILNHAGFISVLKLGVHPAVMWGVMTVFGVGEVWRLAATLGAATPVAAALFVIAQENDAMPQRASTAVLVSTAASVFTLSLMISWLS